MTLPRFLVCRECPEIPGGDFLYDRHYGACIRIVKLESAANPTALTTQQQIPDYNILLQVVNVEAYQQAGMIDEFNLGTALEEAKDFMVSYIGLHPTRFKKYRTKP